MPEGIEGRVMQLEAKLEELEALAKENNAILRSMQRWDRIWMWTKIVLWALVLLLPILFIGPVLNMLVPLTGSSSPALFGVPSPEQIQELYQQLQEQSEGL